MKILYLDCASGVSGDMLLGALVDLGVDLDRLRSRLNGLPMRGYSLVSRRVERGGFGALKVDVRTKGPDHGHRGLKQIRAMIEGGSLPLGAQRAAMQIFRRIIQAEARIHRLSEQRVHLHEVGAVDAIVDVVGAVLGIEDLLGPWGAPERGLLVCSPMNVGRGTVRMEHGLLPVPAPATADLLKGVPIYSAGPEAELVTPTGAAIVSTLASSFGAPPPMVVDRIGYGAGSLRLEGHPNVLRAMLGSSWPAAATSNGVLVLECTIDDMNPQGYGYLMERLFEAGAHEVFFTPVQMKKSRPGVLVTTIGPTGLMDALSRVVFEETTTIGLRYRIEDRIELAREATSVTTRFGKVRVKIASLDGRVMQVQPEYEDCRRLAARHKVPLKTVQGAALAAHGSGAK